VASRWDPASLWQSFRMPRARTAVERSRRSSVRMRRLAEMIQEATVDCFNESEQLTGLFTMIEEHLEVPFETIVLGVPVTVERIDQNPSEQIIAICRRGGYRQSLPILGLPLPEPPPGGAEWIEAYRQWLTAG
jgi:RNase H-fold protein (predicted Holliday junction resolvase)